MRFESCALLGPLGSGWLDVRPCCAERPVVLEEEEGLLAVRRRCVEGTDFSTAAPLGDAALEDLRLGHRHLC